MVSAGKCLFRSRIRCQMGLNSATLSEQTSHRHRSPVEKLPNYQGFRPHRSPLHSDKYLLGSVDKLILDSMSKVVASNNLKAAAENEGQALLITKTKAAEADGNAIKISAEAEKEAARLRGQGVALFRMEVATGMTEAAEQLKQANLDTNVILFSMWTEAVKNFAEYGKGNVIFLDGSPDGMERTMKQIQAFMVKQAGTSNPA